MSSHGFLSLKNSVPQILLFYYLCIYLFAFIFKIKAWLLSHVVLLACLPQGHPFLDHTTAFGSFRSTCFVSLKETLCPSSFFICICTWCLPRDADLWETLCLFSPYTLHLDPFLPRTCVSPSSVWTPERKGLCHPLNTAHCSQHLTLKYEVLSLYLLDKWVSLVLNTLCKRYFYSHLLVVKLIRVNTDCPGGISVHEQCTWRGGGSCSVPLYSGGSMSPQNTRQETEHKISFPVEPHHLPYEQQWLKRKSKVNVLESCLRKVWNFLRHLPILVQR